MITERPRFRLEDVNLDEKSRSARGRTTGACLVLPERNHVLSCSNNAPCEAGICLCEFECPCVEHIDTTKPEDKCRCYWYENDNK